MQTHKRSENKVSGKMITILRKKKGKWSMKRLSKALKANGVKMPDSQISRYESSQHGLKESVAIKILTKGFDMKLSEANKEIAQWQIKEAREKLTNEDIVKDAQSVLELMNSSDLGKKLKEQSPTETHIYKTLSDYLKQKTPLDSIKLDFFTDRDGKDLFLTMAPDDSMSPTIAVNDIILVLETVSPPLDNRIYVVNESLRRFKIVGDVNILSTDNPAYEDEKMNKKTKKIIGQVIGVYKNL